ncbi:MAG: NosD domain-containing protein [Halobacteriota archaeon]|uniref:NosD domain-containing protein n=1 Tax=Natronomonas sp. TaxID=2184060 RepID=UPI003975428D
MTIRVAVVVVCCLLVFVGAASFVVSPGSSVTEPAEFDRTVSMGLTLEEQRAVGERRVIPRAQVAYSQYPYLVGYRGIGLAATASDDPLVEQQFGYPLVVYVETVPSDVTLDESGYLVGEYTDEWVPAADAYFVIESEARTPAGRATVAFAEESRADAFTEAHGGRVVRWDERAQFDVRRSDGSIARDRVATHHAEADDQVADAYELLERPIEIVVGEDEPTLRAALSAARANTTIRLPPGVYEGPVEIDRSVTIAGDGATIVGDGNGTVVTVTADHVAVSGVTIDGIGDSLQEDDAPVDDDRADWDRQTEAAYGYSDAAITATGADGLLVTGVEAETNASGIVLRDVERAVVDDVRIDGTDEWVDGFMGVVAIRSPAVVQRSTFDGGRDAVYTHRSRGITVRENRFNDGRFGVHLMYTSDALVAGNCATDQALSGVVIMTSPSGVAIDDNVVTNTEQGIATSGSYAYIGENTVVNTEQAITTSARNSLYTGNTVVGNRVGFRASSIFPTSVVVGNDVVDNERHVRATSGPLRVWSHDGEGNYWSGAEGLDRPYSPTDPVDGTLHRTETARTLSDAPIVRGLRTLRGSAPGMRDNSVIDAEPRDSPKNATRLERAQALSNGTTIPGEVCST